MDNGRYRVGQAVLDLHDALFDEVAALRVLHGLLHPEWVRSSWRMGETQDGQFRGYASLTALRAHVGPRGANDAGIFRRAVPVLARTKIFDTLDLVDRNRALRWNFATEFAFAMEDETHENWALLDVSEIRQCRTAEQLRVYCHARRVRAMRAPQFKIGIPERPAEESAGLHWKRHWGPLRRAVEVVAGLLDVETLVASIPETDGPGVLGVHVKLRHPSTRWYPGSFEKAAPRARVFRYDGKWHQLR